MVEIFNISAQAERTYVDFYSLTLSRLWLNSALNQYNVMNVSFLTMGAFVFQKLLVP